MWMSHETIHRFIYARQNRHRKLHEYLPRGRKKRRKHHGRKVHSSKIPNRVSIHHRPDEVDARSVFGHWEGDSVLGAKIVADGIHTEVERHTRLLRGTKVAALTPTPHGSAAPTNTTTADCAATIPKAPTSVRSAKKNSKPPSPKSTTNPRKCLSWFTPAEACDEHLHLETTDQRCTSE